MPEPPPSTEICEASSRNTSAMTQLPIAKSSPHLGEQALGPQRQDGEEGEMAREYLPAGIDLRADGLRHAENDAAGQRAPHAAESADDDRLEAEDKPRGPDRRIEIGAHRDE